MVRTVYIEIKKTLGYFQKKKRKKSKTIPIFVYIYVYFLNHVIIIMAPHNNENALIYFSAFKPRLNKIIKKNLTFIKTFKLKEKLFDEIHTKI